MIIGDPLFWDRSLGSYLDAQVGAVDNHVRQHMTSAHLEMDDDAIVAMMLPGGKVGSLNVDFDNPDRDVKEQQVRVRDHFRGEVVIDGVRVTKSFRFSGDRAVFTLRPSSFDTSPPHGYVRDGYVTLGYEGHNDPETIKRLIAEQEAQLRKYVGQSKVEVDAHDARLPVLLKAAVERRRKALTEIEMLKDF
ncbi:hypothetical protein PY650_30940 [Rhizobium calliandrae]|uniref:Uncharacterized protein n=1 Tax=Rhizobium calliandrae TaxID=1312182 RepID=A0ABT7KMU0_9HYPH|nr:hypothetical protein [Rhizobium calliandrae]MDL2409956.1 hypothetical protein [Rhizobium calliandrae]